MSGILPVSTSYGVRLFSCGSGHAILLHSSTVYRQQKSHIEVGFDLHIHFGIHFFPRKPNICYSLVFQPNIPNKGFSQYGVRRGMVIHTLGAT
jgi:hypothetical protein